MVIDFLASVLDSASQPHLLLTVAAAAVYAVFMAEFLRVSVGASVALLLPFALVLEPTQSVAAIATAAVCGAFYSGRCRSNGSIGLTSRSLAQSNLSLPYYVAAGLLSVVALVVLMPSLASLSLGHASYFWLCVLVLASATLLRSESRLKALFALSLGLLLSCVGFSADHGSARFVFHERLAVGIGFLPAVLGLYGLAEILRGALCSGDRSSAARNSENHQESRGKSPLQPLTGAVGWLPALACGIPGNAAAAVMLAVISVKGTQPLVNCAPPQAELVGAVLAALAVGYLLLLSLGCAAARVGSRLRRPPAHLHLPVLLVFCILGAYVCRRDVFDIWVMLVLGIVGMILSGARVPLTPLVLGLFLGRELEHRLIAGLAETRSGWEFFTPPISALLATSCLAVWVYPLLLGLAKRRRRKTTSTSPPREIARPELAVARQS